MGNNQGGNNNRIEADLRTALYLTQPIYLFNCALYGRCEVMAS